MEIKKSLKSLDVKISKLATELGISRPTLDTYIDYFERGIKIPNDVYQSIFEYLFSSEKMTSIEFAQKYDYVKRVMLADVKKTIETGLSDKREEYLANKISETVSSGAMSRELLEFIFLFSNKFTVFSTTIIHFLSIFKYSITSSSLHNADISINLCTPGFTVFQIIR